MKIDALNLISFGPFTDRKLDFSATSFNLVYGPNEGGKSSTLRAIMALLYGIPAKTSDDFVHRYADLRIGATISNSSCRSLSFIRRKKIKGSIVSADGDDKVLADNVLDEFLRGTERKRFEDIHCINHDQFRAGGRLMKELKGLAEDSLLVASSSANFPDIQKRLRDQVDELYAPRKRSSQLLTAKSEYEAARRDLKDKQVSVREWQKLEQAIEKQEEAKRELVEHRQRLATERNKLDRMRSALPKIADWKQRDEELDGKEATQLPGHYDISSREECELGLKHRQSQLKDCDEEICELTSKLESIVEAPKLVQFGPQIEQLQRSIGAQVRFAQTREQLAGEAQLGEQDVKRLLREMGADCAPEHADRLLIPREQRSTIRSLAQKEAALRSSVKNRKELMAKTKSQLKRLQKKLEDYGGEPDLSGLVAELKSAQRKADLDDEIRSRQKQLNELSLEAKRELARLPHWKGSLDELAFASVPLTETVAQFADDFVRCEQRIETHEQQIREFQSELTSLEQHVAAARHAKAVLTEDDLLTARAQREKGWQLIKRSWRDGEKLASEVHEYAGADTLGAAFEEHVADADTVADRLRREADRVAKLAQQEERKSVLEQELARVKGLRDETVAKHKELAAEWERQWKDCGVSNPRSPKEMAAWLNRRSEVTQLANEVEQKRVDLEEKQAEHDKQRSALSEQLASHGIMTTVGTIAGLLDLGSQFVEEHESLQRTRIQQGRDLARLTEEMEELLVTEETAREELQQWETKWRSAMEWIACDAETTSDQANERIEVIDQLAVRFASWAEAKNRLEAEEAAAKQFAAEVFDICEKVSVEVKDGDSPVEIAQTLQHRLNEARAASQQAEQARQSISKLEERAQDLKVQSRELERQLKSLMEVAGVSTREELLEVEAISRISEQRESAEQEIRSIAGANVDFDEFLKQAEDQDEAKLDAQIAQIDIELAELDQQREQVAAQIGELNRQKGEIDGNDSAAYADQIAINRLSQVHELTGRYVRMKIAESILRQQVERYREENKDPLLAKASEYFAAMTCDEFSGLQVDYDEKGKPVIAGLRRENKKTVHVSEMSDGTRDPMFLALRLAYLQRRLGQFEPMPFIVDDILIHLDDERALATLQVLLDLSEQMQVLFFTHHDRLRELAERHLPDDRVTVHELAKSEVEKSSRKPK